MFSQGMMSISWDYQQDLGPCVSEKLVRCSSGGRLEMSGAVLTVTMVGCALALSDRDQGC